MKLLFLCHRLPYPPYKGDKIRALNILKFLTTRHEVFLGCLVDDAADLAHVDALRAMVRELAFERIDMRLRKVLALPSALGSRSITVACFHSRALQRWVDECISRERIEAVFCSSSPMAEYIFRSRHAARMRSMPSVMDLIDVDSFKWHQLAELSPPWTAWIYRHEARCLGAFEQRIAQEFQHVLVVTEQERRYFPGGSSDRVVAMPNGVDLDFFSPRSGRDSGSDPTLVFTGVMSYWPNVDGIQWFVERVFPAVRRAVPDARLYIVGSHPTRQVRRLGTRAGVIVTGFVKDVRDYLGTASACIAPLRLARGVQNKVLEAMAMGRPVVATPEAFEGIDAEPGRDLLVADDERAFASATVELLRNAGLADRVGRQARRRVEERYSWQHNLRMLDEILPATGAGASRTGPSTRTAVNRAT